MDYPELPIGVPLFRLANEDVLRLTEFLYELAGRIESYYRYAIYQRDLDEAECGSFDNHADAVQLDLFDDLEFF
jgi:hypothetical protein